MRHTARPQCLVAPPIVRRALACAVVLAMILTAAQSARAAFPGANGAIAYSHCRAGADCTSSASYDIWLMDADGTNQHQLVSDPGFSAQYPAISADGRWIAFERCQGDDANPLCGIAKVDAHGQNLTQLTPLAPDPKGSGGDQSPGFSPDGSQIVFEDVKNNIAVMGADGSNLHELTTDGGGGEPEFSPDGSKIVFHHLDGGAGGVYHLYLMNADGSDLHPLTSGANEMEPDFLPDGNSVAFVDETGGTDHIATIGIDGSNKTPLTTTADGNGEPAVSPDGTRLVFDQYPAAFVSNLSMLTFGGAGPTALTSSGGDYGASWGPVPTPSIDSPPTIAGAARVGHALTVNPGPGSWGGAATFQWLRCAGCSPIAGATADSYKPTNADIGRTVEVRQTQSSAGGSVTADSATTAAILPEPGASIGRRTKLRHSNIVARLACGAAQSGVCAGRLTIRSRGANLGKASYRLAPGKVARVKVRLSRRGKALFAQSAKVRVKATAVTKDDAGNPTTKKRSFTVAR
jgi:Tol biopolymer transport system component